MINTLLLFSLSTIFFFRLFNFLIFSSTLGGRGQFTTPWMHKKCRADNSKEKISKLWLKCCPVWGTRWCVNWIPQVIVQVFLARPISLIRARERQKTKLHWRGCGQNVGPGGPLRSIVIEVVLQMFIWLTNV